MIDYKIKPKGDRYEVEHKEKIIAQGFLDIESALHCIWVQEGKKPDNYYNFVDGVVEIVIKE